jgi:hypothetical protein
MPFSYLNQSICSRERDSRFACILNAWKGTCIRGQSAYWWWSTTAMLNRILHHKRTWYTGTKAPYTSIARITTTKVLAPSGWCSQEEDDAGETIIAPSEEILHVNSSTC